jgi:hypothetical protein
MRTEPAVREQIRDVDTVGSDPIAHIVDRAIADGSQGARHGGRLRQPVVLVNKAPIASCHADFSFLIVKHR